MSYSIEKTEHYVLILLNESKFDKSITLEIEKQIVVLN